MSKRQQQAADKARPVSPPSETENAPSTPPREVKEMPPASPHMEETLAPTAESGEAWVYILRCNDDSLYTGWTTDPDARLAAHNAGKGAKYTKPRLPVRLVYRERLAGKSEALRRECEIKRMTRAQKLALLNGAR